MMLEYILISILIIHAVVQALRMEKIQSELRITKRLKEHFEREMYNLLNDVKESMDVIEPKRFLKHRADMRASALLKKLFEHVPEDK